MIYAFDTSEITDICVHVTGKYSGCDIAIFYFPLHVSLLTSLGRSLIYMCVVLYRLMLIGTAVASWLTDVHSVSTHCTTYEMVVTVPSRESEPQVFASVTLNEWLFFPIF